MVTLLPRTILDRDRDAIRATLAAFGVSHAGVFGSVARGEDTPRSDLDLMVRFAEGSRRDLIGLADALSSLTGLQVDRMLVGAHKAAGLLQQEIEKDDNNADTWLRSHLGKIDPDYGATTR